MTVPTLTTEKPPHYLVMKRYEDDGEFDWRVDTGWATIERAKQRCRVILENFGGWALAIHVLEVTARAETSFSFNFEKADDIHQTLDTKEES